MWNPNKEYLLDFIKLLKENKGEENSLQILAFIVNFFN